jgi:[acyl-carrier-protein] S-malonyltransferase
MRTLPGSRIAMVAGRPIPRERLEERVAEFRRGPRGRHVPPDGGDESIQLRRWLVQELVTGEVLAHEARAAGLVGETVPAINAAGGCASAAPLPEAVIARLFEIVTADVSVPESELRAYYDRNIDLVSTGEVRHIRHRLTPTADEARAALDSLDSGDLWNLRRGEFTGPFEDAVFTASPGEVVGPIASELGWHIARIERIESSRVTPFEEAREAIEQELLAAARARAFGEWLEGRRQALGVIEPEWEHPAHPVHGMVRHRH